MKFNDFEIITRSRSVPVAVSSRSDLERLSVALLQNEMPVPKPVRLLGVSLSVLQHIDDAERPSLPFGFHSRPKPTLAVGGAARPRTVPNPRSPELQREMGHLEKNELTLPISRLELKSEIAANTGLNCLQNCAENRRLRLGWRRERGSNWRYARSARGE
jgi:hypothetical protein